MWPPAGRGAVVRGTGRANRRSYMIERGMRSFVVLAVALATGCQDFTTLEEACHDVVPGEGSINNADAVRGVNRANCYRRLAGLGRGRVQKHVQAATEAHAKYVEDNQPDIARIEYEHSAIPGYTGYDAFDRLDAAEYQFDDTTFDMGLWELSYFFEEGGPSIDTMIDAMADDPYTRQILLQPSWRAAGLDTSSYDADLGIGFLNMLVVYDYPANQRAENPVVYPKDGQTGVPPAVFVDDASDPLCNQVVGYPVTITVGSVEASRGGVGAANPYSLEVLNAALIGPSGPVPVDVRAPGDADRLGGDLVYTIALYPRAPLEEGAEYTVDAVIQWVDGEKDVQSSFRTASSTPDFTGLDVLCLEDFTQTDTTTTAPTGGGGGTTGGGTGGGGTGTGGTGGTGGNTGEGTMPGAFMGPRVRVLEPGARAR